MVSGDAQTATVGSTAPVVLVVRATGADGAPLSGVVVDFAATTGSGFVLPPSVSTGADGLASARWTLGTAAHAQSATASTTGLPPVSFSAIATAGPATTLLISGPPSLLLAGTAQFTLSAADLYGNATETPPVTWSSSDAQVATISQTGLVTVTASTFGIVTLRAVGDTVSASARMNVDGIQAAGGTATIDGTISPSEWNLASSVEIAVNTPEGTTPGRLYVMNDATDLYLAVAFSRTVIDAGNTLAFEFDSNHDGKLSSGDDGIILNPDIGFNDLVRSTAPPCQPNTLCSFLDTDRGGTNDGAAAFHNDGTTTVYEFRHPLDSGDPDDNVLSSGDRIGMNTFVRLQQVSGAFQDTNLPRLLQFMPIRIR